MALVVAISGGVGVLVMMSRQRDAELALSGAVGTTPAQRTLLPEPKVIARLVAE